MFQVAPADQLLSFKGLELNNTECVLNCGIKGSEFLELLPAQKSLQITAIYGKESVRLDVRPSATINGLKSLLDTVRMDRASDC